MKTNENRIWIILVVYMICSFSICGFVVRMLDQKVSDKIVELSALKDVSLSFEKACKLDVEKNLCIWQKNCREKWKLDYIAWSCADNFMRDPGLLENTILYYGVWQSKICSGEIYYRVGQKNEQRDGCL